MTTATIPACDRHRLQEKVTTAPPIDSEVLFSRCMGDVPFALALLDELETSGMQHVEAIFLHASSDSPRAAAESAHSLKGAAAIIGAEPLRRKAADIEAAGHTGRTSLLMTMVSDLHAEMDRCLTFIPMLRTDLQRRSAPAS